MVLVNDESGKELGNIMTQETKLKAMQRISLGDGALRSTNGLLLLDDEIITEEGAPYVFVQQKKLIPEGMSEVLEYVKSEMDDKTKNKEMSKASEDWALCILAAYRVKHFRVSTIEKAVGTHKDPTPYEWTVQSTAGETWNKSKHGGTAGALQWLSKNFLPSDSLYELKVVTGTSLPKVSGNRKSATGKSDILIGAKEDIHGGSTFDFAMGVIELKTDKYGLKLGQNLLQLLALSLTSSFQKSVALLATDCGEKWQVFHFSDANTITSKVYRHGSKACDDFLSLLQSADARKFVTSKGWYPSLPATNEQDLGGFDVSEREAKKSKAEEDEATLQHFADRMGDMYGERPALPWWSRASARVPDYYV